MLLAAIIILLFLVSPSQQDPKYVANPYLGSFRTGSFTLPMTTLYFSNQTYKTSYDSALVNSTQLQCYSFVSSFQININGSYLDYAVSVLNCS